jgi:glutamate N-acetyltransferase/amino-acid N-acetyltransferase
MQPRQEAADESFNASRSTATLTNDSFVLVATHRAGNARARPQAATVNSCAMRWSRSRAGAQAIVRDGEGATKFITVRIEGGASVAECRQVAFAISIRRWSRPHSSRAIPTWAASSRLSLRRHRRSRPDPDRPLLDGVHVVEGSGRRPSYQEEDGQRVMKQSEIDPRRPPPQHRSDDSLTCDLSYDYVDNADYRS